MTRPCRILMTVDAVGGVWQYATELCRALAPHGCELVLACLGPSPSSSRRDDIAAISGVEFIDTGLDLDWLAPDAATVAATAVTIAALAVTTRVDIVHLNQPALAAEASFLVPIVAAVHSCVATWWDAVHGGEPPASFAWQTKRVYEGLRRADAVVAPSRAFAEAVARAYGLPALPEVVPNGRTPFVLPPIAPERFAFTAGRLWDRGKNIAALDGVAGRLHVPLQAAGPLIGPNGQGITLHHIAALGQLDDQALAGRLAGNPVFVSAARYEPFGLAVLEAALAGCPLVLADIASFRELWDGAAQFVDPDDEDGFVSAIEALLADDPARARWGAAARRQAARFAPSRMAEAMMAIYARVRSGRDARCAAA